MTTTTMIEVNMTVSQFNGNPSDLKDKRVRSLARPEILGTIVRVGETRGMDEVVIHWDNDPKPYSVVFIHQCENELVS